MALNNKPLELSPFSLSQSVQKMTVKRQASAVCSEPQIRQRASFSGAPTKSWLWCALAHPSIHRRSCVHHQLLTTTAYWPHLSDFDCQLPNSHVLPLAAAARRSLSSILRSLDAVGSAISAVAHQNPKRSSIQL